MTDSITNAMDCCPVLQVSRGALSGSLRFELPCIDLTHLQGNDITSRDTNIFEYVIVQIRELTDFAFFRLAFAD